MCVDFYMQLISVYDPSVLEDTRRLRINPPWPRFVFHGRYVLGLGAKATVPSADSRL